MLEFDTERDRLEVINITASRDSGSRRGGTAPQELPWPHFSDIIFGEAGQLKDSHKAVLW